MDKVIGFLGDRVETRGAEGQFDQRDLYVRGDGVLVAIDKSSPEHPERNISSGVEADAPPSPAQEQERPPTGATS